MRADSISPGSPTRAGSSRVESTFERLIRFPRSRSRRWRPIAGNDLPPPDRERRAVLGRATKVKAELDSAAAGDRVLIACHNAAEVERLGEVFGDTALARRAG